MKILKHISLFESFKEEPQWKKLNEIGDRITSPVILKQFSSTSDIEDKMFFYNIEINQEVYQVIIQLYYNVERKTAIKIDFGKLIFQNLFQDKLSIDMTNSHIMLKLMSNLVGVFKQWIQDYPGNETIVSIIVGGKSENKGDFRRSAIYNEYIKKNVEKFGVKIIEILDITKEWIKIHPQDSLSKVTKYRIEPITLEKMREVLEI